MPETQSQRFQQPSRKRQRAAANVEINTSVTSFEDNAALLRFMLSSWAWHPLGEDALHLGAELPIDFASSNPIDTYKSAFRPFIAGEAVASISKESEEDVRKGNVFAVELKQTADLGDGRADVKCVLASSNTSLQRSRAEKKLRDGAIVFLCSFLPRDCGDFSWQSFLGSGRRSGRMPAAASASTAGTGAAAPRDTPVVLAGYVKYSSHSDLLLEVQTGYTPPISSTSRQHPCPHAWAALSASLDAKQTPGGPVWTLAACSAPVTHQREMAALERMCRSRARMEAIITPRQVLQRQGPKLHLVWPAEVSSREYVDHVRAKFDPKQCEAVEISASLAASDEQVREKVGAGGHLLPFVFIQGPPGTGKTHTVQGILNTWHLVHFLRYYTSVERILVDQLHHSPSAAGAGGQQSFAPRPRILVCAPSNAATDELLERLLRDGFVDKQANPYKPRVVRVGSTSATLSPEARQVCVSTTISEMLSMKDTSSVTERVRAAQRDYSSHQTMCKLSHNKLLQPNLTDEERTTSMATWVTSYTEAARSEKILERWQIVYEHVCMRTRTAWDAEEALMANLMEEAEIVFTTLSSTGRRAFLRSRRPFDLVLIDEAAQASEVASLQPLALASGRCVFVGDPQQLPATVLSRAAKTLCMDRSLFERLRLAGWPVQMLTVQYRMHRSIRKFPSQHFYDDRLEDGANVTNRPPMPFYKHGLLKPYVVFDVAGGRDRMHEGGSRYNIAEVNLALALFQTLESFLHAERAKAQAAGSALPPPCSVGIISPYKEQCKKMREAFDCVLGPRARDIKIDTVDSFQGKQMGVIIMSCVRAAPSGVKASNTKALLGFVEDVRRMNVGITRAQHALWILGNVDTLCVNEHWKALVDDAMTRSNGACLVRNADAAELMPAAKLWDPAASVPPPPPPKSDAATPAPAETRPGVQAPEQKASARGPPAPPGAGSGAGGRRGGGTGAGAGAPQWHAGVQDNKAEGGGAPAGKGDARPAQSRAGFARAPVPGLAGGKASAVAGAKAVATPAPGLSSAGQLGAARRLAGSLQGPGVGGVAKDPRVRQADAKGSQHSQPQDPRKRSR